jgi:ribonuclease HII
MKKILGIDEAGRGSLFGSMFVAGVLIDERKIEKLIRIKVRDSKELEPEAREKLALKIQKIADRIQIKEITAQEIDRLRNYISLNEIEIRVFAQIIEECGADEVFIDMPEVNGEKFLLKLKAKIRPELKKDIKITAENFADKKYPVVSAASIIAKYNRDMHIAELAEKYNFDFKTGYSHDQKTLEFIEEYLKKHKKFPEEVRKSWDTAKSIAEKYLQKRLFTL